jgi:hypothetical protein
MSLSYHQRRQLHRIEAGLRRADPQLGVMLGIFGRLYPDQEMPGWEQVPQVRASQSRLRRVGAWIVAVLAAGAAPDIWMGDGLAGQDTGRPDRHHGSTRTPRPRPGTGGQARTSPPGPTGPPEATARAGPQPVTPQRSAGGLVILQDAFTVEPWNLQQARLHLDVLAQPKSVFALADGYVGWQANLDEGEPHGLPGTAGTRSVIPRPPCWPPAARRWSRRFPAWLVLPGAQPWHAPVIPRVGPGAVETRQQ